MTKNLHKTTLIRFVSSLKLTVICLLILIIIIIWGTVYQSNNGLFQAQQKFFHSWVFFIFGFIPFPGTNLTLTILFLNLIASMVFRIGLKWQKSGIILIHLGIIVLLVGGFISSFSSIESVLQLKEGGEDNLSAAYHKWEIAVWQDRSADRTIFAVDADSLNPGDSRYFEALDVRITIENYYKNSLAFQSKKPQPGGNQIANSSGIILLRLQKSEKEPSQNVA